MTNLIPTPSTGWVTLFWIGFTWNVCLIPITLYYVYIYIQRRDETFFRPRMPNATVLMIFLIILSMISRIFDGFIGIGYIPDHFINVLLTYVQMYPTYNFYIYKCVHVLYKNSIFTSFSSETQAQNKTDYTNNYYLFLVCMVSTILPCHKYLSNILLRESNNHKTYIIYNFTWNTTIIILVT